jgi:hypothetical protein
VLLRKTCLSILSLLAISYLQAQVLSSSQSSSTVITQNLPAAKSSWTTPTNASLADNAFTTTYVMNKRHSEMLVATNWGFSVGNGPNQIPSNAVINGFEVEVKMRNWKSKYFTDRLLLISTSLFLHRLLLLISIFAIRYSIFNPYPLRSSVPSPRWQTVW